MTRSRQTMLLFGAGLALGLVAVIGTLLVFRNPGYYATEYDPPAAAYDFDLQSDQGAVHLSDYQGKVVVIYFGYTYCPDVCPATLGTIHTALRQIGERAAGDVQVVMVSVDPERDTPERLGEYMRAIDPSFVGVSGTLEETSAVTKQYGVFHAKQETTSAAGYLVDHTSSVFGVDRQGRLRLLWSFDHTADEMAQDLKRLLGE